MAAPTTRAEYDALFQRNQRITGFGLDVTMHVPCPFCCAPDFMVYRVMETRAAMERGAVCAACGSGSKAIVTDLPNSGITFEFVQTVGPDAPAFVPAMRRVEA